MSGSGGSSDWKNHGTGSIGSSPTRSGGGIGGGGFAGGEDKCEIFEETPLNSPNPAVIKNLRTGEMLTLQIQGSSVVAYTQGGAIAGSITFRKMADLIDCVGEGWSYGAEVKRVSGGLCVVFIRPVGRP